MKTIAIDFDGVIHSYHKKWHDGTIYGDPVQDCKVALQNLLIAGFEVVIYSTRTDPKLINGSYQSGQLAEMVAWLKYYDIPYTRIHFGAGKPLCMCFIDDNAIRFENWSQAARALMAIHNIDI